MQIFMGHPVHNIHNFKHIFKHMFDRPQNIQREIENNSYLPIFNSNFKFCHDFSIEKNRQMLGNPWQFED